MEPGRQLDAEIAKKLFRWIVIWENSEGGDCYIVRNDKTKLPVPHFSTDDDDAYRIVNGLQDIKYYCTIRSKPSSIGSEWQVAFHKGNQKHVQPSKGKTLPHAICLAALALKEGTNQVHFQEGTGRKK